MRRIFAIDGGFTAEKEPSPIDAYIQQLLKSVARESLSFQLLAEIIRRKWTSSMPPMEFSASRRQPSRFSTDGVPM